MNPLILCLLTMLFTPYTHANEFVVPGDSDYFVYQKYGIKIVAPENYGPHLPKTLEYMNEFVGRYTKSFSWTLDEPIYLVLASENNQIANGFATVSPNLMTLFYPSGQLALEDFAQYSWFLALASHETAHLFQLNNQGSKYNFNRTVKPIVRNAPFLMFPFGIPMFVQPNQFLPRFILEGNAVMNESRIGKGGRLQAGRVRAVTYALIKADRIDFKYLLNEHLEFPFGNEKYWYGGYLFAHLTEKYGIEKTNRFFYTNGGQWINPLLLRGSFLEHFKESYAQVLTDSLARFRPEALKQVSASEPALAKGVQVGPLNHDQKRIYFLKSDQLQERPKLMIYDKTTGALSEQPIDLSMGKVFPLGSSEETPEWTTAASLPYKATKRSYGLYGVGLKAHREYLNKIVIDQRGGNLVSIDPVQSLLRSQVSVNNQYWGETDSIPYLDDNGDIYDFIQNGDKRILRKNQKPLTTFTTYDAAVVNVLGTEIYFISTTPYGSSLFVWNGKEVLRLHHSDALVDAEMISKDQALAVEATATGYDIKVIHLKPYKANPVVYSYRLGEDLLPIDTDKNQVAVLNESSKELQQSKRPYNGLIEDWRWSNLTVVAPAALAGIGTVEATFVDPLLYHMVSLGYAHGLNNSHNGAAVYRYSKHLINLLLLGAYSEPITVDSDGNVIKHEYEHTLGIGLQSTPFWQWRRWQSSAGSTFLYEKENLTQKKSTVSNVLLSYSRSYPRAYAPDRLFSLFYKNKISSMLNTWSKDDSGNMAQISTNLNLGAQVYWSQSASIARAEKSSVELTVLPSLVGQNIELQRLYDRTLSTTKLAAYRMGLLKAFNTPLYTTRFPFGLRRTAPFADAQMLWLDQARQIFEYQAGTQFETLVFQSIPMRFAVSIAGDDRAKEVSGRIQLSFQQNF